MEHVAYFLTAILPSLLLASRVRILLICPRSPLPPDASVVGLKLLAVRSLSFITPRKLLFLTITPTPGTTTPSVESIESNDSDVVADTDSEGDSE